MQNARAGRAAAVAACLAVALAACDDAAQPGAGPSPPCTQLRAQPSPDAPRELAWNFQVAPREVGSGERFAYCLTLGNRRAEETGPFVARVRLARSDGSTAFEREARLSGIAPGADRTLGEAIGPHASGTYLFSAEVVPEPGSRIPRQQLLSARAYVVR